MAEAAVASLSDVLDIKTAIALRDYFDAPRWKKYVIDALNAGDPAKASNYAFLIREMTTEFEKVAQKLEREQARVLPT